MKRKILKFLYTFPKVETLIKFLEINGKNLIEFCVGDDDVLLNSAIAKFCPNLKSLCTIFTDIELETVKMILNNCQYLENLRVWCGDEDGFLNEKEFLDILVKYSPKNFYKLEIYNCCSSKILPEELEEFFIGWKNRMPQKSFSLTIYKDFDDEVSLEVNVKNMEIIEKYKKMGVIKKFMTRKHNYYED
ncbi:hypothetical protein C1645_809140 [Glomus cerebriforme]|uniref:F-box domain-containing protein n=1 Tax=Glomus cerebriforme TaxID=658196 RepID=A0A397SDK5_9GLOM|nr:hypothetical protein C1645_809140 [Glomus cerebriforme]